MTLIRALSIPWVAHPLYLVTDTSHNAVRACLHIYIGTPPYRAQTHTLTQPLRCVCRSLLFK